MVTFIPSDVPQRGSDLAPLQLTPMLPPAVVLGAPALPNPAVEVINQGPQVSLRSALFMFWVPSGGPPIYGTTIPYDALVGPIMPGQIVPVSASVSSALPWPTSTGSYDLMIGVIPAEDIDRSNNLLRGGTVDVAPN